MDDINKNNLKMQNIFKELDNLKVYTKELFNNTNGQTIENYIYKLEKDIIKTQSKLETINTEKGK